MHFSISLFDYYNEILWNVTEAECDSVNMHVTLSNFESLLRKFKYFITALINAEQLLL